VNAFCIHAGTASRLNVVHHPLELQCLLPVCKPFDLNPDMPRPAGSARFCAANQLSIVLP
jgi:hypothetical protein